MQILHKGVLVLAATRRRERLAFDTDLGLFALFFFGMSENGTTTNIDQRSYVLSFFCLAYISDSY